MAGPKSQVTGELVRPKFNIWGIMDHALGEYVRGEDGLWYLNGGFGQIMAFGGRGNTFKSFLQDLCIFTILFRYKAEWGSKYDTEVSGQLSRLNTVIKSVFKANCWEYDPSKHSVEKLIDEGKYNYTSSDVLKGEDWWSDYVRDEVEARFKQYESGKNLRETPFPEPLKPGNRKMVNPWIYGIDSLTEFHTEKHEKARDGSDIGDSDQNTLSMTDNKQKGEMMSRWPAALARGGMYLGFVAQMDDSVNVGGPMKSKTTRLDEQKGDFDFKGVPKRQVAFLTNSFLVAAKSGELDDGVYNPKTGAKGPMFPSGKAKAMTRSGNDLKLIRYNQWRAKSGPTGVKFDMIFSQEEGFKAGLSYWWYLKEVLKVDYGFTRSGHFYELDLLPGIKFARTTVYDLLDDDYRFFKAMEITACLAYMQNNWITLGSEYQISPKELYEKIIEKGFDWNEIFDNTVYWWMYKDQEVKGGVRTLSVMSLLDMAIKDLKPKFLTCKVK